MHWDDPEGWDAEGGGREGEGERVQALESREGTRASRRVEEGLSRSLSGGGGKPSFPSPSAGDLRELPSVPRPGSPVPSTPERREGLRACYWEGPSELPERRTR